MPVSEPEIRADLDRLRAAYAIKVHKLETQLDQAKLERARQVIEINRRDASISALETDVVAIKSELDENVNARRVLEQTVADRLPKVEARLTEAKRLLSSRDREIAELAQGAKRHQAALEEATSINAQRSAEIDRLSSQLATKGARRRRVDGEPAGESEVALHAEVEALRAKAREQAMLIDRLQRRLGEGYGTGAQPGSMAAGPAHAPSAAAEDDIDRLRESIADAESVLELARTGAPVEDPGREERERELRALKAQTEDQAGEIARLKAALEGFERGEEARTGLRNSRLALRARAGSAEAQAERQAETIGRLRAELAAAHERLAQQAAHFMDEMRRIGAGTQPATGQARRSGRAEHRRRQAERVREVTTRRADAPKEASAAPAEARVAATVGENGAGNGSRAPADAAHLEPAAGPQPPRPVPVPETAALPQGTRKGRLVDRITGLGKT
jgi:chromosome segregation ATPase